ncbi:MAG: CoA-binding protein [Proteobacteria bacterium]|nr:CoA-binding protein [Pseudomonadota bacterium]
MSTDGLSDAAIRAILTETKRIALVGASASPGRPSNEVMGVLLGRGYDVTPINPGLAGKPIHGRTVAASLDGATPLEMVDIFRASDQVGPVVDEAIRLGAKVIWMQLGVVNEEAAAKARAAGMTVVMNRCPLIESHRLGIARHP